MQALLTYPGLDKNRHLEDFYRNSYEILSDESFDERDFALQENLEQIQISPSLPKLKATWERTLSMKAERVKVPKEEGEKGEEKEEEILLDTQSTGFPVLEDPLKEKKTKKRKTKSQKAKSSISPSLYSPLSPLSPLSPFSVLSPISPLSPLSPLSSILSQSLPITSSAKKVKRDPRRKKNREFFLPQDLQSNDRDYEYDDLMLQTLDAEIWQNINASMTFPSSISPSPLSISPSPLSISPSPLSISPLLPSDNRVVGTSLSTASEALLLPSVSSLVFEGAEDVSSSLDSAEEGSDRRRFVPIALDMGRERILSEGDFLGITMRKPSDDFLRTSEFVKEAKNQSSEERGRREERGGREEREAVEERGGQAARGGQEEMEKKEGKRVERRHERGGEKRGERRGEERTIEEKREDEVFFSLRRKKSAMKSMEKEIESEEEEQLPSRSEFVRLPKAARALQREERNGPLSLNSQTHCEGSRWGFHSREKSDPLSAFVSRPGKVIHSPIPSPKSARVRKPTEATKELEREEREEKGGRDRDIKKGDKEREIKRGEEREIKRGEEREDREERIGREVHQIYERRDSSTPHMRKSTSFHDKITHKVPLSKTMRLPIIEKKLEDWNNDTSIKYKEEPLEVTLGRRKKPLSSTQPLPSSPKGRMNASRLKKKEVEKALLPTVVKRSYVQKIWRNEFS